MRHNLSSTLLGKWRFSLALGLLVMLMMGNVYQSSAARAAGSGPIIHWNSSMIYAGQNNGNPWGPVGENASVNGQNFPANKQLRLILVAGDSNDTPSACKTSVATVSSVTTDSTGQFAQNFSWPVSAGEVNKEYSICAVLASDGNVVSSHDDGPFTVLAASPPVIALSASSVTAGNTLTITGHSWVPPQPVNINIAGCADCEPGNTEVASTVIDSTGLNDGSFSVSVTIPASTKTGNYVVNAFTQSGLDANYIVGSGVQHLAINGATPTATATSTATVTPTVTATVTATVAITATTLPTVTVTTVASNSNTSTNDSSNGGNGPMILLFVALGVLLLAIAGVVIFMFLQRSSLGKRPSSNTLPTHAHDRGQSLSPYGGPSSNPGNAIQSLQYMQQDGSHSLYGQNAQISNSLTGFGQTGGSGANYSSNQQTMQQYGTAYTHGEYEQSGPLSNGTRSAQQPGPASIHNEQTVAMQNYGGYGTIAGPTPNLAQCRNCGSQLNPNDLHCGGCGMPVTNPHTSMWGR
jgi:hypothetical protein